MKILLLDMDGVLADFEGKFYKRWLERHPNLPAVHPKNRLTFYIEDQYGPEYTDLIRDILCEPHFALDLELMPGAMEAIDDILTAGQYEIGICTSPLTWSDTNASDKVVWTKNVMGEYFLDRLSVTTDKTWTRGAILIDDRQWVKGTRTPEWTQILMDAPYNRNVAFEQRFTWDRWREFLD